MPVDGIRISGNADVTAIGANGAAGIGSGANADAANIEIAGGIVNATAGSERSVLKILAEPVLVPVLT